MRTLTSGAPQDIYIKLFDSLYFELKQKKEVLDSFVCLLQYEVSFDKRTKAKFGSVELQPVDTKI